jgi:multicomponent Na+:H+ antiporter subunit G
MKLAVDLLLALSVLAAWLGCAGFARLRAPLDRMHCVAFVNATSGVCVLLAALLAEGPTTRVFKILLIVGVGLLDGAAMSHATGRALLLRGTLEPDETTVAKRS